MTTSADRQAAYRKRMRKAGYEQVLIWIQPKKKQQLLKYAEFLRNLKLEDPLSFE